MQRRHGGPSGAPHAEAQSWTDMLTNETQWQGGEVRARCVPLRWRSPLRCAGNAHESTP